MKNQYRIQYWVGQRKYTTVIGTNNLDELKRMLRKQYDRFTIEEQK